jgi:hypothetical protein
MSERHRLLDIAGGGVVVGLAYSLVTLLSRTRRSSWPVGAGVPCIHRLGENDTWLLRLRAACKGSGAWLAQRGR